MPSGWRMEARSVIERAIAEAAGKTTEETITYDEALHRQPPPFMPVPALEQWARTQRGMPGSVPGEGQPA